METII